MSLEFVLENYVEQFHEGKDPMHNINHVRRLRFQAFKLCRSLGIPVKEVSIAIYYHGLTKNQVHHLSRFLKSYGYDDHGIERLVQLSAMMHHDAEPTTSEEKIIHDCHILEGGKFFFGIKSLITGSHRNQTIQESIDNLEKHLSQDLRCYFPQTQKLLKDQIKLTRDMIEVLRENLPI